MANRFDWVRNFKEGLDQAKKEKKIVLLDFFNPG